MATCTSVGFNGTTGFQFSGQNAIPNGVPCVLAGWVRSSLTQTATIKDSSGTVVAQIQGAGGTGGAPVAMTPPSGKTGYFTANGNTYTLTITNSGTQASQVISANDAINWGSTTYAENWTFVAEDVPTGGDCDFNDATIFMVWNLKAG